MLKALPPTLHADLLGMLALLGTRSYERGRPYDERSKDASLFRRRPLRVQEVSKTLKVHEREDHRGDE